MESMNKPMLRLVPNDNPTAQPMPELDSDLVDEARLAARLGVS